MKFLAILAIAGLVAAMPAADITDVKRAAGDKASGASGASGSSIIAQLQSTFDRNNPNGTPTSAGDPDDLNGDGVINAFEAGAQAA